MRSGSLRNTLLARGTCILWRRRPAGVRRGWMLRSCVLTGWNLRCNVRGALAERGTGLRVLMERRTWLRTRHTIALRGSRIRRPVGELPRIALHIVRCAALRRSRIRRPVGELPRIALHIVRCTALRRSRIRRPVGELPRIVLRIVRSVALRIELLLTRGIAGRTVRERLVGTRATLCAGLVILRMREVIVALSVAVLDCSIVIG